MRLNPYGEDVLRLAISLTNDPPSTVRELVDRCQGAGLVLDGPYDKDDLQRTRAFLADWLAVVDTPAPEARASLLNDLLRDASAYPRLTNHAPGDGWHLHYREPGLPLASVLRTLICVATALHLSGRGMHRLGRCSAQGCNTAYADFSRTGGQRFCSPACGNREGVRRHRERTQGSLRQGSPATSSRL